MTDLLMRSRSLWCGALVLVDGAVAAMVQRAEDGEPVRVIHRDGTREVELVDAARLSVVELPRGCWTHSKCGTVVQQRGERTSHCPKCHVTYEGLTLFDAHQRIAADGSIVCLAPEHMRFQGARLRFVPASREGADGSWRGPKLETGAFG